MAEREILFRGKLKDKDEWIGEWIEGIYCPCYWDLYMRRVEKPRIIILSNKKKTDGLWREVIPETVGQYTGLTDKNGVRIFEGDIVATKYKLGRGGYYVFEVYYNENLCQFALTINSGSYTKNKQYDWLQLTELKANKIEVIGNIHDNPDMLRGGGDNG